MRTKSIFISILLFLLLGACNNQKFKSHPSGLKYRFIIENKSAQKPQISDIIAFKFSYFDNKGNEIEASDFFRTQLQASSHSGGAIEDALALMHVGDSAIFLIKAQDYFTKTRHIQVPSSIQPGSDLTFNIKLLNIISDKEFEVDRQTARMSGEREEDRLLQDYLLKENIKVEPTISGMYFICKKDGTGAAAVPGRTVTVHYSGSFINGNVFDSSYDRKEPFTFRLGVGDVIQGLDEGISKMKVGGKAKLIIPSSLAYGDEQVGPIPPFATLIFDVELLDIQK